MMVDKGRNLGDHKHGQIVHNVGNVNRFRVEDELSARQIMLGGINERLIE